MYWRHISSLGNDFLVALFVVDAGLALLHLNRLLDILGPGLRVYNAEDDIDLLEGQLLGLGNKHPDEDSHGQTEDGEHQECAPADTVDGGGSDFSNNEVEEPLGRS